ncbi:MAG: prolipoprotein diacylglyceryl transferase [Pseudobdellovibrionaceae bacterium]
MYPSIELFQISIPTYFSLICLGFIVSLVFVYYRLDQWLNKHIWIDENFPQKIWTSAALIMICSLIGARALHVFYEMPRHYWENTVEVFFLWNGGYVYFGGLILSVAACWIYLRWSKEKNLGIYFDFYAPVISLGYIIGRFGCFLNGCCYGKYCDLPWGITSADGQSAILPRHPTQLYAMILEFLIFVALLTWEKRNSTYLNQPKKIREAMAGSLFACWLLMHAASRFLIEQWRDDFRGPQYFLSVSSWMSVFLFAAALVFLIRRKFHSDR